LLWDLTKRWLRAVGVSVTRSPDGGIKVAMEQWGTREPHYPRTQRDPGPFLATP
jgi:hypothetical protein